MNCTLYVLQRLTWWWSRGKYKAGEYLKTTGLPYTIVYNSFYYENLASPGFNMLRKGEKGTLTVNFGTPAHVHLPSYSVDETGGWVLQVFKRPSEYLGMFIPQARRIVKELTWVLCPQARTMFISSARI